jgi:hypothetical protein
VKIYDRALNATEILADYNSFLEAKFVDANILDAGFNADWNRVKINSDVGYDFGKEICGSADTHCNEETYFSDQNLVGLWHFNGDVTDSSYYGNNGTWSGDSDYESGLWNTQGTHFTGTNDRITTTQTGFATGDNDRTFSAWIKSSSSARQRVYGYGGTSNYTQFYINIDNSTAGCSTSSPELTLLVGTGGPGTNACHDGIIVNDGKWHNIVVKMDDGVLYTYVDGIAGDSRTPGGTTNTGTTYSYFGETHVGSLDFDGVIEEATLWKKALTEQEIVNLYRKGISRLDLNVISCSDATCTTETDSLLIEDANNGSWMDISSLTNSQYLRWEGIFGQVDDFNDRNAGFFHVGAILHDVNIEYEEVPEPDVNVWAWNFTLKDQYLGTNVSGDLNMDCNVDAYDLFGQSNPI